MQKKKVIDVYPYRVKNSEPEFLLFQRAKGKIYQGQWRMIGGKVKENEAYWQAGLRELKEETGLEPKKFWTLPGINSFYEHKTDQVLLIPAFAAELEENQSPVLDDEHTSYQWLTAEKTKSFIPWPEQIRLIQLAHNIITSNQILDDWLVSIS
ncbi:MAG: NUDIX pyrophosphatase [Balneolaceae bacterium]